MSKENRKKATKPGKRGKKLIAKAIVFLARRQGAASPKAVERFREKLLGESYVREEIDAALREAQAQFEQGDAHLLLCKGSSCKKRKLAKPARKTLKDLGKQCRLQTSETRCLGPCGHAPTAVLRVGERCRFFVDLNSEKSIVALQSFIAGKERPHKRSVTPSSKPDAVEAEEPLVSHLEPLRFLLGCFQGDARRTERAPLSLRVTASLEAGGQALAVRILERGKEKAEAGQSRLYVIHWNSVIGELEARVHTSQGSVLDGPVLMQDEYVILPDVLPIDAPVGTISAQRRFRATAAGLECALEIYQGGAFDPWLQADLMSMKNRG